MSITSRRTFLQASGAVAAAACAGAGHLAAAPLQMPIGLQLYSVRNLLPKDFDGTLHQLKAAGYYGGGSRRVLRQDAQRSFATPWTRRGCAASARTTR